MCFMSWKLYISLLFSSQLYVAAALCLGLLTFYTHHLCFWLEILVSVESGSSAVSTCQEQ